MKTTLVSAAIALLGAACATVSSPVPDALAPPSGQTLAMTVAARGVQVYECRVVTNDQSAWAFVGPEAELFDALGKRIGHHGAGPHWTAADGSRIVGRVTARADAPEAGAIPWLLLATDTVGTARGAFSGVTSVQRVHTAGGVAPATPCNRSNAGTAVRIPYTADYRLFTR
jgi:Protein of unknown function (DUF3455)